MWRVVPALVDSINKCYWMWHSGGWVKKSAWLVWRYCAPQGTESQWMCSCGWPAHHGVRERHCTRCHIALTAPPFRDHHQEVQLHQNNLTGLSGQHSSTCCPNTTANWSPQTNKTSHTPRGQQLAWMPLQSVHGYCVCEGLNVNVVKHSGQSVDWKSPIVSLITVVLKDKYYKSLVQAYGWQTANYRRVHSLNFSCTPKKDKGMRSLPPGVSVRLPSAHI